MTRKRRPRPGSPAQLEAVQTRDAIVLAALLAGRTLHAAAELAGCSRPTVDRLLADPAFRAQLEAERMDLLRAVTDRLGTEMAKSVEVLAMIRDNPKATWSSRVRAASRILDLGLGRPSIEINQTTNVTAAGGPQPAELLAAFLGKLQQRAQPPAPPAIEVTEVIDP